MKRYLTLFCITVFTIICLFLLSGCKASFKINFIVDDEVYKTIKTNGNEIITLPDDPNFEGRTFEGWYWDKDTWKNQFTARSLLDAPLSSNMNIYAHFKGENYLEGTNIEIKGANKVYLDGIGDVFLLNVKNSQVVFKFNDYVLANPQTTWTLSTDLAGNNTINSKTVELKLGDNILYYIYVTDKNNNHDTYIVLIHRKYIYTVSFDSKGGTPFSPVQVEEGDYLENIPIPEKKGCTFVEWDYKFNVKPITNNVRAVAKWYQIKYEISLDTNGGFLEENKLLAVYSKTYVLPIPTRDGYDFIGWKANDGTIVKSVSNVDQAMVFVAQWKEATYSITYDLNGGQAPNNPTSYTFGTTTYVFNPSKTGYEFVGWISDNVDKGKNYTIPSDKYGDINLVASFKPKTFIISFDADEGKCNTQYLEVEYDSNFTLPLATKEGYNFIGWYEGSEKIKSGIWEKAYNVNARAKYSFIKYEIKYEIDGGINQPNNPTSFLITTPDLNILNPNKIGYTFIGWTTSDNSVPTKDLIIKSGTNHNLVLTANWEPNKYVITFDVNTGDSLSSDTLEVYYDSNYELPTPTKLGYAFKGWFVGDEVVTNGQWKRTENLSLKAKWELDNYNINYVLDGGTNDSSNPDSFTYFDESIIINDPSKLGYTFLGWITKEGEVPTKNYEIPHNSSGGITLYACWEANKYTISYDVNGGKALDNSSQIVAFDDYFTLIEAERIGYNFAGWYNEEMLLSSGKWEYTKDITLTANWSIINYKINYVLNGGTNDKDNPNTFNFEDETIIINSPKKTGYTFIGWKLKEDDTPTINLAIPHNSIGIKTIEAVWEASNYNVVFDANGGNVTESQITVAYNSNYEFPIPIRNEYTFLGWYNGNDELSNSGTWTIAEDITLKAKWTYGFFENGINYCYFGKYPQTHIADSDLIYQLDQLTITNENGYYEYNGEEYCKHQAKVAKIYKGSYWKTTSVKFDDGSIGNMDEYYWFKVEPIKWIVVSEDFESFTLLSDKILTIYPLSRSTEGIYRNYAGKNFSSSVATTYLNEEFYNNAFSDNEKLKMNHIFEENYVYVPSSEDLNCYFNSSQERKAISTDYCRTTEYYASDSYWLSNFRSTIDTTVGERRYNSFISSDGYVGSYYVFSNYSDNKGLRPIIKIN